MTVYSIPYVGRRVDPGLVWRTRFLPHAEIVALTQTLHSVPPPFEPQGNSFRVTGLPGKGALRYEMEEEPRMIRLCSMYVLRMRFILTIKLLFVSHKPIFHQLSNFYTSPLSQRAVYWTERWPGEPSPDYPRCRHPRYLR